MAKRGISYVQQDEPSFIKQFKKNVGYKEGPTIDTKKADLQRDESGSDEEDERPTVVVLKKGDISQEEYDRLKDSDSTNTIQETKEDEEAQTDEKIVFKKPTKKSSDKSDLIVSTKKKDKSSKSKEQVKDKMKKSKMVSNKKLLSFGDEEEDD